MFSAAPAMNVARSSHAAVALKDGRILVAGGKTTGGISTNAVEIYSSTFDSWIVIGSMTDARAGHTAVLLKDGRVLLAGGEGSAGAVSTLEVFDPADGTFTFAGTMSSARKDHAAALLADGKVLIVGGSNGSSALATADIYDSETGAVSAGPVLSTPRTGLSATTLMDGNVLIAGGNNGTADLATAEVFNSTMGVVSPVASLLATARRDHSAFLLPYNNHVLIVGGTSGGTALAAAELFRPWDGNFHSTGSMLAARVDSSGSPLGLDGLLLVAGGTGAASSELYGFATVKTDRDDYAPGELVTMTGSGWQPGETVTLFLHEINNPDPHDDLTLTAVANASGRILNNQFAPDEHDAGIRFYLTATGSTSQAQTTFTDSVTSVTITSPTIAIPITVTSLPASVTISFNYVTSSTGMTTGEADVLGTATPTASKSLSPGSGSDSIVVTIPSGTANGPYNAKVTVTNNTGGGANQKNDVQNAAIIVSVPTNTPPTVTRNNASVTVNEGQTAPNTGTYSDVNAGDNVTISASVGIVTKTGTNSGTWSWSFGTIDGPDQSQTVTITANDGHGGISTATFLLTVSNVAPTVAFTSGPTTATESGVTEHTYTYSITDPGTDTISSVSTSCGTGGTKVAGSDTHSNTSGSFKCTFPDGPSSPSVTVSATDSDGDTGNTTTRVVTVDNAAPTVALTGPTTADEGQTKTYNFTVTDPGVDTFSVKSGFPDCGSAGVLVSGSLTTSAGGGSFQCTFPDGPATSTVRIQVTDSDGADSGVSTVDVTVVNLPPTVSLTGPATADEGQTKTYNFTVNDAGADTFTVKPGFPDCGAGGTLVSGSLTTSASGGSFQCSFPDGPAASTVRIQVTDSDGADSGVSTVDVTVVNLSPTVSVTGPAAAGEGEVKTYSFTVSDPGVDTFTLKSGFPQCGTGGILVSGSLTTTTSGGSFQCSFPDGPASPIVRVQVTDSDGADSTVSFLNVSVANLAPTVALTGPNSADEGQTKTYNFTVSDPGDDTFAVTVSFPKCGSGGSLVSGSLSLAGTSGNQTGSFQCYFPDGPASPLVQIRFTDSDNDGGNIGSVSVTVNNIAPSAAITGAPTNSPEGTPITLGTTTPIDPSPIDTAAGFSFSWTVTKNGNPFASGSGTTTFSFTPNDNGTYVVTMGVKDKDGDTGLVMASIAVTNVAPSITGFSGPMDPIALGSQTTVTITANFSDAGASDTHTCTYFWDDKQPPQAPTSTPGVVTEAAGSGSCTGTFTYTVAGVYSVTVVVQDDDGESTSSKFEFVVIYDPSAGFVTGGGWIQSREGAYTAAPSLTGKANFGFVSKYLKGSSVPTGETEFQLHFASFNFHSTSYQWLVVSGAKAQYKGSGQINGTGNYGFLLTATDGQTNGGGGIDKFRIKIWDIASSNVVYDNMPTASDDIDTANPQEINGGSITIHAPKK